MTTNAHEVGERRWLTLGLASALLGINEATLRHWSDNGLVRAFRTPGGHRRFSAEDIYALMESASPVSGEGLRVGGAAVLPRIRRRLRTYRPRSPSWMGQLDAAAHDRMRRLGRTFLDLCLDYVDSAQPKALSAAAELGEVYAREIASCGISLSDALGAFVFFRDATIEAIKPALLRRAAGAEDACAALERLWRLTDQALVNVATSYDQATVQEA